MPRANTNEYLATLEQTNGQPLLHTVLFESIHGPSHVIAQADELLHAAHGLSAIAGVREVRHVARSSTSNYLIEELALNDSVALQQLRTDPIHDAVVKVAAEHTNWKVVDRLLTPGYAEEPLLIAKAKQLGGMPVMSHAVVSFSDEATKSDIDEVLGRYRNVLGNAGANLVFPAEVSEGLDRRKGDVAIVRSAWTDQEAMYQAESSVDYQQLVKDLGDIASQQNAVHHI